jgi:hypothetical protein
VRPGADSRPDATPIVRAEHGQLLAIERDDGRLTRADVAQTEETARPADADLVLGIEREDVVRQNAAARAERHPLEMTVLRHPAGRRIRRLLRADRRVADGDPADSRSGGDVALHQCRRDAECARDVVESRARVVGRQHRRHLDREMQQIANGVGILGAIEPVQSRSTGIRIGAVGRVEGMLEPGDDFSLLACVRPRRTRRRHESALELANRRFPDFGLVRQRLMAQVVERKSTGKIDTVVTLDAILVDSRPLIRRIVARQSEIEDHIASNRSHGSDAEHDRQRLIH